MKLKIGIPHFSRRERIYYTLLGIMVFIISSTFSVALRVSFYNASAGDVSPPPDDTIEAQYTIIYGFTSGSKITTIDNEPDKPMLKLTLLDGVSTGTFSFTESWDDLSLRMIIPNGYGYQVIKGEYLPDGIDKSIQTQAILYKLHLVDPEPQVRQEVITETFSFNGELLPLFIHVVPTSGYVVSTITTDHVGRVVTVVMFDSLDHHLYLPVVVQ